MTRDEIIALAHKLDVLDTQHYGTLWVDKLLLFASEIEHNVRDDERENGRAIYVGAEPAGFAMVEDGKIIGVLDFENPPYYTEPVYLGRKVME